MDLLIVNPNSSQSVTDNLEQLLRAPPGSSFQFYTGPKTAPKEIDGPETSQQSAKACFPELKTLIGSGEYSGALICCYSDHPLIHMLREITDKPIIGIFQASISYALTRSPSKFGILTSTTSWEKLLDSSVRDFFGNTDIPLFTGTIAANINVLDLNDPKNFEKLVERAKICVEENGSEIVLLGCAGLSGLEAKLESQFDNKVRFVDSVKFGAELLNTLVRFDM